MAYPRLKPGGQCEAGDVKISGSRGKIGQNQDMAAIDAFYGPKVGSDTRPKKRIAPVLRSEMANKNG